MITTLEEFKVYNLALKLGERVWVLVVSWNHFEKETIGKQLVRACDSIAANLSEGLSRYHVNEIKNFSYYSRGSLFEVKTWLTKAHNRNLIDAGDFQGMMGELEIIGKMLNRYIATLKTSNLTESKRLSAQPQVLSLKT